MIGKAIGPYQILAELGRGGMGEVYRARDTKLGRDVALKILPESFADDPDRLMRFEREARTLASLNHQNIASIYGIEDRALVMELVEGEDLSTLIGGALRTADALTIARQIADALEAAHALGIIHRDLKPANIKVRTDGAVKVLDFGLAKALDQASPSAAMGKHSDSARWTQDPGPTMTSPAMTAMGLVLGTAAYMSPEQARGKPVDTRADIWAFGVVLFEMLTGKAAFHGETMSDVIAAVLTRELDWKLLPPDTPPAVRRLLRRCLERDPRRRLRDIGDARLELEETGEPAGVGPPSATRGTLTWLPWSLAVAAIAVALWAFMGRAPAETPRAIEGHFSIDLPATAALVTNDTPLSDKGPLAVSPDGSQVVYVAPNGASTQLFTRAMTALTPRLLPGTEGGRFPFFSPDGQWVGFFAGGKLKKVRLTGITTVTLADASDAQGGSWNSDGRIVFAPSLSSGLFAVPDAGGTPARVTTMDSAAGEDVHAWPQVLPGHRAILFTAIAWSREASEIVFVSLDTGVRRVVQSDASFAKYVPAADGGSGHLVFVRDGDLMAAPFDPARAEPAGTAVTILDNIRAGQFDISASGVLAYAPGSPSAFDYSLVWVDRTGAVTTINDLSRGYEDLGLSPDGRRVAVTVEEPGADSPAHVSLADTERRTLTRFTFEGFSRDPIWAPNGQSVVYGSKRGDKTFGLYAQRLDGKSPAELAWASPVPIWPDPSSFTPDSRTVVFTTKSKDSRDDIWTLSLDDHTARPWLATPAIEYSGRLSPDGKWIAYNSNESGRFEVYVQSFPTPGAKTLISAGGGANPIWSRDGREIFYRHDAELVVVKVGTEPNFTVGAPVVMFSGPYRITGRDFDVSPDGRRFVMMRSNEPRTTTTMRVVLNWWRALDGRLKGMR